MLWQNDHVQVFENAMDKKGTASLALLYNESEDCRILVHGENFSAVCDQDAMNVLDQVLRRRYELKIVGRLSMDSDGSESEVIFLDRLVRTFRESTEF